MILTFIGLLREQRKLEEYHPQLVGELLLRILLGKNDIRAELLLEIQRTEIQECHKIYRVYRIVPCRTSFTLAGYRLRYIVYTPVLEEWLRLVLHLYNDLLAVVGLTIYVIYQRPVLLKQGWLFLVEEWSGWRCASLPRTGC